MATSQGKLRGQMALATGGSCGFGTAIARTLAGEGATVGITCVAPAEKAEAVVSVCLPRARKTTAIHKSREENLRDPVSAVLQRFGRLEESASAVVFLASPKASDITGSVLDAEGVRRISLPRLTSTSPGGSEGVRIIGFRLAFSLLRRFLLAHSSCRFYPVDLSWNR